MKTENARKLVAEWLEDPSMPAPVRRDAPALDLAKLREILAVAGPRRAGKTWYMYQLIGEMLDSGTCGRDEILFVDFEDYRLADFGPDGIETLLVAFNHVTGKDPGYLFFDEIQHMPEWSRVLRTLHNRRRYRIVVSGSNSDLLGREVSTELRGRFRDVLILPFSFAEMLRLRGVEHSGRTFLVNARGRILKEFDAYLKHGGFPEVLMRESAPERRQLLQNYFRTIFYRDILERHNIKAKYVLDAMMKYCLDAYSDLFSISAFAKTLAAAGLPGSKRTISNYLQYLSDAFFLITSDKFSFSPRKRLMNPKKIYLLDTGFSLLSTDFAANSGKILENAVAIELFRRQEEFFHFRGRGECDFIVKHGRAPDEAIQVSWELNSRNRDREIAGLVEAMTSFDVKRALVLTYDQEDELNIQGRKLQVMPVWKWLLS